jgi:alpha-glucuronidase
MRAENRPSPVKEIVEGRTFHQPTGGFVSVVNAGMDANWLHHPMAMANLYGFGKLAWNPDLSAQDIVDTWTRLTFSNDRQVVRTIDAMQMSSWRTYEEYTGNLGIGGLTDILGIHYGPGVGSAENNGWGQWFRADHEGVGMDRTVATGTGYIGQYPPELAAKYESLQTCPDDLLLFMHHVPYTFRLHTGETVIQHIYNAHYDGAAAAARYPAQWSELQGKMDPERFALTLHLLRYQAGHAIVWRDAVTGWFAAMSGIPDALGRVGVHPNRIEAESMSSDGYHTVAVTPVETASGGKAVVCEARPKCTLSTTVMKSGRYRVAVQYFDLRNGISHYTLLLNGLAFAQWTANDILPPAVDDPHLDGHTSTRFTSSVIRVEAEDRLMLLGQPEGGEAAPVDYLELLPETK